MAEMNDQVFELLLSRFDKLDETALEVKTALLKSQEHQDKQYASLAVKVEAHTTYWSLLTWFGGTSILGILGYFGFKP